VSVIERMTGRAVGLADRHVGRRGFLSRSAMVGSALAVAPKRYVLQPGTAYAAICGCGGQGCACGSLCCDGFTEFCCSMTGENRCPPGSVVAGWWKVDASQHCGGAARYYFDCNAPCVGCGCGSNGLCGGGCSGTPCGCANGDCGLRKAGCNVFRYGNCHNDVPCVGPIVCRVVGCIPPWEVDPTCTALAFVSEATRSHDAGCLHQPVGAIDHVEPTGDAVRVRGWSLDPDRAGSLQIRFTSDQQDSMVVVADQPRPDVAAHYPGHGPAHGFDVTLPGGREWCVAALSASSPGLEQNLGCFTAGATVAGVGYWMVDEHGNLYPFGVAEHVLGSKPRVLTPPGATVVDLALSADGRKMWALDSSGRVHAFGAAQHLGDASGTVLDPGERWQVLVSPPDGSGYWLFSSLGRGVAFGVPQIGDVRSLQLLGEIVAAAATPTGRGAWLLGSDGGVFALGDAPFRGSVPETIPIDQLVRPLTGIAASPQGGGYWLFAEDGGVFAFGAPFRGSLPAIVPVEALEGPVIGGVPFGNGYALVGSDGGAFVFADRPFLGSLGGQPLPAPIVSLAAFG
jgi:hypothetical protein